MPGLGHLVDRRDRLARRSAASSCSTAPGASQRLAVGADRGRRSSSRSFFGFVVSKAARDATPAAGPARGGGASSARRASCSAAASGRTGSCASLRRNGGAIVPDPAPAAGRHGPRHRARRAGAHRRAARPRARAVRRRRAGRGRNHDELHGPRLDRRRRRPVPARSCSSRPRSRSCASTNGSSSSGSAASSAPRAPASSSSSRSSTEGVKVDLREFYLEIPHQTRSPRTTRRSRSTSSCSTRSSTRRCPSCRWGTSRARRRTSPPPPCERWSATSRSTTCSPSATQINEILRAKLDEVTERWGVKVTNVEIREIIPPPTVQEAMTRQMSAERTRRAIVTEAEGTKQAAITVAEGNKAAAILNAEGSKQSAILNAEGERQAAILRAEGFALALDKINELAIIARPEHDEPAVPRDARSRSAARRRPRSSCRWSCRASSPASSRSPTQARGNGQASAGSRPAVRTASGTSRRCRQPWRERLPWRADHWRTPSSPSPRGRRRPRVRGAGDAVPGRSPSVSPGSSRAIAGEAEDAVQEAFVKAYYALPRFRPDSPFRPWLLKIVANEARNRVRSTRRRQGLVLRAAAVSDGDAAPSPETAALAVADAGGARRRAERPRDPGSGSDRRTGSSSACRRARRPTCSACAQARSSPASRGRWLACARSWRSRHERTAPFDERRGPRCCSVLAGHRRGRRHRRCMPRSWLAPRSAAAGHRRVSPSSRARRIVLIAAAAVLLLAGAAVAAKIVIDLGAVVVEVTPNRPAIAADAPRSLRPANR